MSPQQRSGEKGPIEHHMSAGGVVYRFVGGVVEVLLCGRNEPLQWALPKGTPDSGETVEETALREVQEETGIQSSIIATLGSIRYSFIRIEDGVRCSKVVHYFLMEPLDGDTSQHDHEFDVVSWFPAGEALRLLTYPNEAAVLERAVAAAVTQEKTPASGQDTAGPEGRG